TVAYAGLTLKAPHAHAALLYIDWLHSREGQQLIMKGGLWSPREYINSLTQKFKKSYIDEKYSVDEAEKKYAEWEADAAIVRETEITESHVHVNVPFGEG